MWDSYRGGYWYLQGDYLETHALEWKEDFENRKRRAYYLNNCKTVVHAYTNLIFRETIVRTTSSEITPFINNADKCGTSLEKIMKKVSNWSSIYGKCYVFVDMPKTNGQVLTLQDVVNLEIFPYVKVLSPLDIINWQKNDYGEFEWVLIRTEKWVGEYDKELIVEYRRIGKDSFILYDTEGNVVEELENPLGVVPIVEVFHDEGKEGLSLIEDIAYINRTIYNWTSNIDEMIERQTFSQLVYPDDGSLIDNAPQGVEEEDLQAIIAKRLGTAHVLTFPANSGQPPHFISPDTRQLSVIWDLVKAHIREIYREAGLVGTSEDLYGSVFRSGRMAQVQHLNISSFLKAKADNLEEAENKILKLYCKWMDKEWRDEYASVYPKKFNIFAIYDFIRITFDVVSAGFSKKLNKILLQDLAKQLLLNHPDEVKEEVRQEIEQGDGTINVRLGNVGFVPTDYAKELKQEIESELLDDNVGRPPTSSVVGEDLVEKEGEN